MSSTSGETPPSDDDSSEEGTSGSQAEEDNTIDWDSSCSETEEEMC